MRCPNLELTVRQISSCFVALEWRSFVKLLGTKDFEKKDLLARLIKDEEIENALEWTVEINRTYTPMPKMKRILIHKKKFQRLF
jgi:hypothetical protein